MIVSHFFVEPLAVLSLDIAMTHLHRILILGGTTEARQFAGQIAERPDLDITLSLAGRTRAPVAQGVPVRSGGFGGVAGLADYLVTNQIDVLIDATHPYAAQISANALEAANLAGVKFMTIRRPAWRAVLGDQWREVTSVGDAIELASQEGLKRHGGHGGRNIFVALGRQELGPLSRAPEHHYIIRSVDPVEPPVAVPNATYILGRGQFDETDERALLQTHAVELIIAKNSGGDATYSKLSAARDLSIPVILIKRPTPPSELTADRPTTDGPIADGTPTGGAPTGGVTTSGLIAENVADAIKILDHLI